MTGRTRLCSIATVAAATFLAACSRGSTSGAVGTPSAVMAAAATPAALVMPAGVTPAMITRGDSLFNANACSRCHGKAGAGGQNGPVLVKNAENPWLHSTGKYEEIVATITAGVPKEKLKDQTRLFQMNPRGSNPPLNDDQIKAVAAYIWKLNHP